MEYLLDRDRIIDEIYTARIPGAGLVLPANKASTTEDRRAS